MANSLKDQAVYLYQHIVLAIQNFIKYFPLLGCLISRDLKKKYRRSLLGYVWTILNPLLIMIILNFVFSNMFRNNIANYPVYLFVGRMLFSFITESTTTMSRSIISNGALMRKTRIPYYIFPISSFSGSVISFSFTLIAFVILMVFTQTPISIHVVAFPVVLLQTFMFAFGLGMILALGNVVVRDIGYLYAVVTTGWMYLTPLFYPLENLPDALQHLISNYNPAYFFIKQGRDIFLYHQWPDSLMMQKGFIVGAVFLLIGMLIYSRVRNKLILYV